MIPLDQISAAFISLVIGTLLGSELTRLLYRPRVFIRYREISPLHAPDGIHWTVQVANFGRTVASDCKGVITIDGLQKDDFLPIEEAIADEILPSYKNEQLDMEFPRAQHLAPDFFREIKNEEVSWAATGNPAKISINPGITENLDIFKVQESADGQYILIPSGTGWRKLRARLRQKSIAGRIMVCPSNEFPTVMLFELTFSEDGCSKFKISKPGFGLRLKRLIFRQRFYYG